MLNFFRRIFRAIFGGSDPEPTTQQPPVVDVPEKKPTVPETAPPPVEEPPKSEPVTEPIDEPVVEPKDEPATQTEIPIGDWPKKTVDSDAWVIELNRYSVGKHDILGKLIIDGEEKCYTLEAIESTSSSNSKGYLTKGVYDLKLRTEGGKHPTYIYRFGELHKGMLWIADVAEFPFALIHIGNKDSDTPGSILVGREPQHEAMTDSHREVWYSQQAYMAIYSIIADKLSEGIHVQLKITE